MSVVLTKISNTQWSWLNLGKRSAWLEKKQDWETTSEREISRILLETQGRNSYLQNPRHDRERRISSHHSNCLHSGCGRNSKKVIKILEVLSEHSQPFIIFEFAQSSSGMRKKRKTRCVVCSKGIDQIQLTVKTICPESSAWSTFHFGEKLYDATLFRNAVHFHWRYQSVSPVLWPFDPELCPTPTSNRGTENRLSASPRIRSSPERT